MKALYSSNVVVVLGMPNREDFLAFLGFLWKKENKTLRKKNLVQSAFSLATPHHFCFVHRQPRVECFQAPF